MTEAEQSGARYAFEHVTTNAAVEIYEAGNDIFISLLKEVKELSKKKPDSTMNANKVKIINRVLEDLLIILKGEPSGKYLDILDEDLMPQTSDAVLIMVQFESALVDFKQRYRKRPSPHFNVVWITEEIIKDWEEQDSFLEFEEDEDVDY